MATIPTLTAAALTTSTIRLGPLVASPNFRHPVPFAKELMTLDDMSEGRLTVGIGAGGVGWDATMLGGDPWSARERADRFSEFVEQTDLILRQEATTSPGRFYTADGARNVPGCVQQPRVPFAIAATGPRGMELAARYGEMWVTTGDVTDPESKTPRQGAQIVRHQMERLDRVCDDLGRDPSSLARMVLTGPQLEPGLESYEQLCDAVGAYGQVGITDYAVHWPRPGPPYEGDVATFEELVTRLVAQLREAGPA